MSIPVLCHVQSPVPNAYTLAIAGRKPFVVVHTALLELLEPLEVQVSMLIALYMVSFVSAAHIYSTTEQCALVSCAFIGRRLQDNKSIVATKLVNKSCAGATGYNSCCWPASLRLIEGTCKVLDNMCCC